MKIRAKSVKPKIITNKNYNGNTEENLISNIIKSPQSVGVETQNWHYFTNINDKYKK